MKTFFYTLRLDENRSVCLVKEKELDYHEKCTVPATVVELLKNCFDIQQLNDAPFLAGHSTTIFSTKFY